MKILILGSGPAGGLVGSRLIEAGADVTFAVRPVRQRQLMTRGLYLRSPYGQFRRPVRAITPAEITRVFDLVVPAVRACEVETALELAASAIGHQTVVMPIVEGIAHMETTAVENYPQMVGAVLETRTMIDADGILSQRPPHSELHVGALRPGDEALAQKLADLFVGRGLATAFSDRIRAKCFCRFAFMAAGIGTSVLLRRPLRDTLRFAHGAGTLEGLLKHAIAIGRAAGFDPSSADVMSYTHAYLLEGRPVMAPPMISDYGGRASDEAAFLLGEMVALARRSRISAHSFEVAWRTLTKSKEITVPVTDVSVGL